MKRFHLLLNCSDNSEYSHDSFAVISGSSFQDFQTEPSRVKEIMKTALAEWLDLPHNKEERDNFGSFNADNFKSLLTGSMHTILAKHDIYDLDIQILSVTPKWKYDDNLLN
jgi:hypothetical protein